MTHIKRTMVNRLLLLDKKVMLHRRTLMETVFDQRKHLMQIESTRHRSPTNVAVNLVAGLITYGHQPHKLSIYGGGRPQPTTAIPN